MSSLSICLRDISKETVGMVVEVKVEEEDWERMFEQIEREGEGEDKDLNAEAFLKFVKEARSKLPLPLFYKEGAVDVFISWWGDQETFEIPKEFFDLISETAWSVTFDIND